VDVSRDTRLDMPFATEGQLQSLSAQFNGGPLGGSATYQRYTSEFRSYTVLARLGGKKPGSQPLRLTFGLTRVPAPSSAIPGDFFWSQQFSLGGVQFGEMLRGYPEFSITPTGYLAGNGHVQRAARVVRQCLLRVDGGGRAAVQSVGVREPVLRCGQPLGARAGLRSHAALPRVRHRCVHRDAARSAGDRLCVRFRSPRRERPAGSPKWQLHFRLGQIF
jgi:outer membrane protein assembly factor BamA